MLIKKNETCNVFLVRDFGLDVARSESVGEGGEPQNFPGVLSVGRMNVSGTGKHRVVDD